MLIYLSLVCISQSGPNNLARIQGRYGSAQFFSMMNNHIVPILKKEVERIFIMDLFPIHVCSAVKKWFDEREGINLMLLPAKSCDFNPISQVGDALVRHINWKRVEVKNLDELWLNVSTGFKEICTNSIVQNAVFDIREKMNSVCDSLSE